jgi:hypothetical protein
MKSKSYEAPHYAAFSNPLSLHCTSVQIYTSAPCSLIPSVYISLLISEIEFRNYTEAQAEL